MNQLTRIIAATVLTATLAGPVVGLDATTASAQTTSTRKAPCKPYPWHLHKNTYSNVRVVSRQTQNLGQVSQAIRNPYSSSIRTQVRVDRAKSKQISVNASVEVEASGLVAAVRASTGIDVATSVTSTVGVDVPLIIPAKKFGWVQAENETVTITATVTSLDLMCNVVDYRGTIRSTMPRSKAYLTPKVAASAP